MSFKTKSPQENVAVPLDLAFFSISAEGSSGLRSGDRGEPGRGHQGADDRVDGQGRNPSQGFAVCKTLGDGFKWVLHGSYM